MARPFRYHRESAARPRLVEILEQRALLCDVTAGLSAGVLDVAGGHSDDSIALIYSQDRQSIEVHGEGHAIAMFPASQVQSVRIQALSGNDHITLDPMLDLATVIDGGAGTDTVVGLAGVDQILNPDAAVEARTERSFCVGVECFQDSAGDVIWLDLTATDQEPVPHLEHNAMAGVLSSVHESRSRKQQASAVIHMPTSSLTDDASHFAHATITQPIASVLAASNLSHHGSGDLFDRPGFLAEQARTAVPVPGYGASINASGSEDHSVGGHSFGDLSAEARAASANPDFATRSPYETECPASSPVGAAAVASASSPVTVGGEIANTVTGAPKIGCKCLAMQVSPKNGTTAQNRHAKVNTSQNSAVTPSDAQSETEVGERPQRFPALEHEQLPSCCERPIDTAPNHRNSESAKGDARTPDVPSGGESGTSVERQAQSVTPIAWQGLGVLAGVALTSFAVQVHSRKHRSTNVLEPEEVVLVASS
jgi:hypothetical protein